MLKRSRKCFLNARRERNILRTMITSLIERNIALFAALAATFIFALFVVFTSFPLQADDYAYLAMSIRNPHFIPSDIEVFTRMPITVLLSYPFLKYRIWESFPKFYLIFFFSLHAVAFTHLTRHFIEKYFTYETNKIKSNKLNFFAFTVSSVLFALYPNDYEIHLWHGLAIHSVGALLVSISFTFRKIHWKLIGTAMSFLVYDTFPFFAVGLFGLDFRFLFYR